jgi:hypothetical protein
MIPSFLTTYLAIEIGDKLTFFFPASYLLTWIKTLVVSIGWITAEAILPDSEPIKKGVTFSKKVVYFFFVISVIITSRNYL